MDTSWFYIALVGGIIVGFDVALSYMCIRYCGLYEENQRLKQKLDSMRYIEELSYKTYCSMLQEAAYTQQQQRLTSSPKRHP